MSSKKGKSKSKRNRKFKSNAKVTAPSKPPKPFTVSSKPKTIDLSNSDFREHLKREVSARYGRESWEQRENCLEHIISKVLMKHFLISSESLSLYLS